MTVRWRLAILLSGLFIVQSCKESPDKPGADTSLAMQQMLRVLNENNSVFTAPAAVQFPQDLGTHDSARTESFLLKAIVSFDDPWLTEKTDQPVSDTPIGIIARIDRLALTPGTGEASADSAWRYTGVMRSSVFVDTSLVSPDESASRALGAIDAQSLQGLFSAERRQSVQRMALDLAGVTHDSLWVGDNRITISRLGSGPDNCARAYRWEAALSATVRVEFDVTMGQCPELRSLGAFNSWQQTSPKLNGVFTLRQNGDEDISIPVSGSVWISQSWGNLPATGGAVAIDFLQVRLDDSRWLDVSRSKRLSGRGPRTVSATVQSEDSEPLEIPVIWQDSVEQVMSDSGVAYPEYIELRSNDDLALSIKVMNRFSESAENGENRLDVPVAVTGTHTGAGFLSFRARVQ